jgi:hypothetical protein
MAEVVAAFKQISAAGKQSAHETGEAFKELKKQFQEVGKGLLAGLSIVYAADKLKELFKQTLENADALTRLKRQTGLSTDAIQAFGRAAVESGSSVEAANAGLTKLTLSFGKAQIGSKDAQGALRDLGISSKELNALSPDQKLQLIASRLAGIEDPGRRARDEVALLGKSSNELDQALVKLGQEGIDGLISKLQHLGVFLDQESIARFQRLGDQLRDAKLSAQGLGTQFLTGLAPSLTRITGDLQAATNAGEGFRLVGVGVGVILKSLVLLIETAGKTIGLQWALLMNHMTSAAEAAALAIHGHLIDAAKAGIEAFKRDATILKEYAADVAGAARDLFGDEKKSPEAERKPTDTPAPPDEALLRARYNLLAAQLDNELKLFEAHNQLRLAQEKASYENGDTSLREYYARRAQIINENFDKEIATLKAKLAAQEKLPPATGVSAEAAEVEKRIEREKLLGQIRELNAQRDVALQTERNTLFQQETAQTQAQIKAEQTLLTIAGKRTEAARLQLGLQAQALAKSLVAGGVAPDQAAGAVGQFTAQGNAKIDFDEATRQANATLKSLEADKQRIQNEVNQGLIFSINGEQQILDKERAALPVLQAQADAMLARARAAGEGNEELVAQAEQFKQKVGEIAAATNTAGQYMKEFRAGVESSIGAGLNTFLDEAIFKSKSLGQAFDTAMKQIFTDLAKLVLQIEEQKFLKWLFGGGGGGLGGGGGGGGLGGLGALFAASGGYIRGPGTTTSDSIPALVSDREFIVNAAATRQPGVLPFLEALNAGGPRGPQPLSRFAAGGSIGGPLRAPSSAPPPTPVVLRVHPDALHMTLRDWFEREVADIAAKR